MKTQEIARYNKIALDIAYRIQNNELLEGMRIKGRSQLSSQYNVSPETIRRAIGLLKEMEVVDVVEKSGITVKSKKNALHFIKTYDIQNSLSSLQNQMVHLFEERKKLDQKINDQLNEIFEVSTKLKHKEQIPVNHCEIPNHSQLIGKSLKDVNFYQHTKATVIAVSRNHQYTLSVGPTFLFQKEDILFFVCESDDYEHTIQFIKA